MTKPVLSLALLALALLLPVSGALADYYKYTDSRGVTNMTNKLESVPARYRATMTVVREEPKKAPAASQSDRQAEQAPPAQAEQSAAPAQAEQSAAPAQAPEGKFAELSARFAWFKPLVYVGIGLALLVVVMKVTALLPSPMLAKAIWAGFFFGVSVFLYTSYVKNLVEGTHQVKEKAVGMMKKSMVREAPAPGEEPAPPPR